MIASIFFIIISPFSNKRPTRLFIYAKDDELVKISFNIYTIVLKFTIKIVYKDIFWISLKL